MWEFTFYSRGGQGAVTAAKILISAAILEGRFGQAIPSYGQERKGAPVYGYARIDDHPIDLKSYVYEPGCIVLFDPSLIELGIDVYKGAQPGALLVANTRDAGALLRPGIVLWTVSADRITLETAGDVPPNMAMLGAVVRATGCVSIDSMTEAIRSRLPGKAGERSEEACRRAYEETRGA